MQKGGDFHGDFDGDFGSNHGNNPRMLSKHGILWNGIPYNDELHTDLLCGTEPPSAGNGKILKTTWGWYE